MRSDLTRKGERVGLENLGNTCFLNAVMQALYNIDVLQMNLLSSELSQLPMLAPLQIIFGFLHLTMRYLILGETNTLALFLVTIN